MEISRRMEVSERPVIREREVGDHRFWDVEAEKTTIELEASQLAITEGSDNTALINSDTTT